MLEINTNIRSSSHTPERTLQFPVMYPDLHILSIQKLIQPSRMVEMEMSNDDFLDILDLIARGSNSRTQLMFRFITDAREDIADNRTPDFRIVFAAASFPEDEAFMGMFDEDAVPGSRISMLYSKESGEGDVHWQFSSLVDKAFRL